MEKDGATEVVIRDIHMSFWSMVLFIFKWSLASIPALILLALVIGIGFSAISDFISDLNESVGLPANKGAAICQDFGPDQLIALAPKVGADPYCVARNRSEFVLWGATWCKSTERHGTTDDFLAAFAMKAKEMTARGNCS